MHVKKEKIYKIFTLSVVLPITPKSPTFAGTATCGGSGGGGTAFGDMTPSSSH